MKAKPRQQNTNEIEMRNIEARYATERRRQLIVLLVAAAAILIASAFLVGPSNIFLPHWWHIDLP